jgi:DNA end-binding protein Ku
MFAPVLGSLPDLARLVFYRLGRWGTTPAMQTMWAGTLGFGPDDIPVRLGPATRPRELAFRQVHAEDGGRITVRRSCTSCGADVAYADVAKAYQRPDGALVPLTDEDLARLPLEASHRIDVLGFTDPGAIDPLLVSRSYFLVPDAAGARAFARFHTALSQAGRIAVASITLRQREARATVWPRARSLVLQTLLTPDEVTEPDLEGAWPDPAPAHDPELADLTHRITAMTRGFDPAEHRDTYRDQLEALIQGR